MYSVSKFHRMRILRGESPRQFHFVHLINIEKGASNRQGNERHNLRKINIGAMAKV